MKKERIEQISAACEAATDGPWLVDDTRFRESPGVYTDSIGMMIDLDGDGNETWVESVIIDHIDSENGAADAHFIAMARAAIPELLSALDSARDTIRRQANRIQQLLVERDEDTGRDSVYH